MTALSALTEEPQTLSQIQSEIDRDVPPWNRLTPRDEIRMALAMLVAEGAAIVAPLPVGYSWRLAGAT